MLIFTIGRNKMALQVINRNSGLFTPSISDEINVIVDKTDKLIDNLKVEPQFPVLSYKPIKASGDGILWNGSLKAGSVTQINVITTGKEFSVDVSFPIEAYFNVVCSNGVIAMWKVSGNTFTNMTYIEGNECYVNIQL